MPRPCEALREFNLQKEVRQMDLPMLKASEWGLHGEQAVDIRFADDEVEEDPYLGVWHGQELDGELLAVLSDTGLVGRGERTAHSD